MITRFAKSNTHPPPDLTITVVEVRGPVEHPRLDAQLWTYQALVRWRAAGFPPAHEFEEVLQQKISSLQEGR